MSFFFFVQSYSHIEAMVLDPVSRCGVRDSIGRTGDTWFSLLVYI